MIKDKAFDITAKDDNENTVFHLACINKSEEMLKLMLELSKDVEQVNKQNETPYKIARKQHWKEGRELLKPFVTQETETHKHTKRRKNSVEKPHVLIQIDDN